jgi:hypothetical protein
MIDIIKPSTILVIFSNVIIFMFMQILLFWYVISKEIEHIIINKSSVVKEIIRNSTTLRTKLDLYVQSTEYQQIYKQSLIEKEERINFNMKLTWQWMLIPFLLVTMVLVLGIIYTVYIHRCTRYNTLKLDKTDYIILATVFFAFLTEIIFIFVLVMRYVYISDMDVVLFFINSKFGKELLKELPSVSTFSPFSPFSLPPF